MPFAQTYFRRTNELLDRAWQANRPVIGKLAPIIGASVASGGVIHTFGSGHSEVVSREIIGRAGGLVCVSGVIDPTGGFVENLPSYGLKLIQRYDRQYQLREGEVMIVISNSGKNAAPVDVALYAAKKKLTVVALTCVAMSRDVLSMHTSGKRLFECTEHVLDNKGVPGDAVVEVSDGAHAGPTSTVIGCSILNWLMLSVTDWLKTNGHSPPILRSQNIPGAIEHNRTLAQKYQGRLSRQLA